MDNKSEIAVLFYISQDNSLIMHFVLKNNPFIPSSDLTTVGNVCSVNNLY